MKLQKESREIDLYVSNKRMTAKEAKEFSDFIEQVKKKTDNENVVLFQRKLYKKYTYLGKKKVLNVAAGMIFQKDAMWRTVNSADTLFENLNLFCVESFLDRL